MIFFRDLKKLSIAIPLVICLVYSPHAFSLSYHKEKELSREFMEAVHAHFLLIRDPFIVNYVNRVGQRILSHMPPQPFDYKFYVIKDREYNAFAGPGGVIFIHSGLLAVMDSEEELAGILSHEISHVTSRHISERIDRSNVIGLATLAGIAAGILLGVGGVDQATEALAIGSVAASQTASLAYSREDEMEADKKGLHCLQAAGYSGKGLLSILRKIRSRQWYGPNEIPTYLMTHPALEERLTYIGAQVENEQSDLSADAGNQGDASSDDFKWVHTKLYALYEEEDAARKRFSAEIRKAPNSPLAHYGYGLIMARIANEKEGIQHLRTALAKDALNQNIIKDLGRIYFLDGQYAEAFKLLNSLVNFAPNDPEGRLFLGRTQIALGKYEEAVTTLTPITQINDAYTEAHYYLGEAYEKQNKKSTAYYHLGLFYKENRNMRNAVFHFQRALESAKNPEEKEKIEKALREIRGKSEKQKL